MNSDAGGSAYYGSGFAIIYMEDSTIKNSHNGAFHLQGDNFSEEEYRGAIYRSLFDDRDDDDEEIPGYALKTNSITTS